MKMKNLFAGLVATSMVVAMGTSAMAATYNDKNGTVAIDADLTAYAGEQVTVLIVEADKDGLTPTEIGNEMILYIDQTEAAAGIFQDMGVKGGALEAGKTYIVRIGGETLSEKGIIEEKFTISSGKIYTYGDIDDNGTINATDAGWILSKYANSTLELAVPDEYADVDDNGTINATDAGWVLSKYANSSVVFPAEEK